MGSPSPIGLPIFVSTSQRTTALRPSGIPIASSPSHARPPIPFPFRPSQGEVASGSLHPGLVCISPSGNLPSPPPGFYITLTLIRSHSPHRRRQCANQPNGDASLQRGSPWETAPSRKPTKRTAPTHLIRRPQVAGTTPLFKYPARPPCGRRRLDGRPGRCCRVGPWR